MRDSQTGGTTDPGVTSDSEETIKVTWTFVCSWPKFPESDQISGQCPGIYYLFFSWAIIHEIFLFTAAKEPGCFHVLAIFILGARKFDVWSCIFTNCVPSQIMGPYSTFQSKTEMYHMLACAKEKRMNRIIAFATYYWVTGHWYISLSSDIIAQLWQLQLCWPVSSETPDKKLNTHLKKLLIHMKELCQILHPGWLPGISLLKLRHKARSPPCP